MQTVYEGDFKENQLDSITAKEEKRESRFMLKRKSLMLLSKNSHPKASNMPSPKRVQFVNTDGRSVLGDLVQSSEVKTASAGRNFEYASPRQSFPKKEEVLIIKLDSTKLEAIFKDIIDISYGLMFRTRTWRMRKWKDSVLAYQIIDWLIKRNVVQTRSEGVSIGIEFIKDGWIEHPSKAMQFEDNKEFFCLTKAGKFLRRELVIPCFLNIFNINSGLLIKEHNGYLSKHKASFTGAEFVEFVLGEAVIEDRERALYIGRTFLDYNLIEHVSQGFNFKDTGLLYQLTSRGIFHQQKTRRHLQRTNKSETLGKSSEGEVPVETSILMIGENNPNQENDEYFDQLYGNPNDTDSEEAILDIELAKLEKSITRAKSKSLDPTESTSGGFYRSNSQWISRDPTDIPHTKSHFEVSSPSLLQCELLEEQTHKLFLLEFCNSVSSFKVTYHQKTTYELIADVEVIINQFFRLSTVGQRLSTQIEISFLEEVIELKCYGIIRIDIFDKLINQITCVLSRSNFQINESVISSGRNQVPRRVSYKRLKSPTTSKNNLLAQQDTDVAQPIAKVTATPTETPLKKAQETIIIRRFSQNRGGVKVIVSGSIKDLLAACTEKLKVPISSIREPSTEAEISDISLLSKDMVLLAITDEEEKLFQ